MVSVSYTHLLALWGSARLVQAEDQKRNPIFSFDLSSFNKIMKMNTNSLTSICADGNIDKKNMPRDRGASLKSM